MACLKQDVLHLTSKHTARVGLTSTQLPLSQKQLPLAMWSKEEAQTEPLYRKAQQACGVSRP